MELQRLRPDHESALLSFEQTNRAYFADSISDRGDGFFDQFPERYRMLLADQQAGRSAFYVLIDDGKIVGRFNLYDFADGIAEVGYRVAQRFAGSGVATSALRDLCRIAREQHGLRTLRAATSTENVASQRVLTKAGFVLTGSAEVAGREGCSYELDLAAVHRLMASEATPRPW
jgi:ribosomal-protein-alanine N-acetyltransferase